MCAAKKKSDESSVLGMFFYGMLTALFSALLGGLYMASFKAPAFKSVRDVAKFEESSQDRLPRPGDIYYMQGPSDNGQAWVTKRQAWIDGQASTVDFKHGEFNAWLAAKFRPAVAPSDNDGAKVLIIPGVPNIYLGAELITLSLPTKLIIYGNTFERTVFMTGVIDTSTGSANFVMKTLNIDNASVPFVDLVGRGIVDTLLKAYSSSDEFAVIRDAWLKIESVEQSEGTIRFKLR